MVLRSTSTDRPAGGRHGAAWVELLLLLVLILVTVPLGWLWWHNAQGGATESAQSPGANGGSTGLVDSIQDGLPDPALAKEFGRRFEHRLRAGESAFLNDVLDYRAILRRIYGVDELTPAIHGEPLVELQQGFRFGDFLLRSVEPIEQVRFVRVVDRDGRRYLLFRRPNPLPFGSYFELQVVVGDRGGIRVADVTMYPWYQLSEARRLLEITRHHQTKLFGLVPRGDELVFIEEAVIAARFLRCDLLSDHHGVVQVYEQLPLVLRNHPHIQRRTYAAMHALGLEDEAMRLLSSFAEQHPDDPHMDLVTWSYLFEHGRYDEALAVQDRLEAYFGPDAGLDMRRGAILVELGRPDEARESFRLALKKEPDLRAAYERLIRLAAKQRDFDGLVDVLQEQGLHTGEWLLEPQNEPGLREFASSIQFRRWIDSLRRIGAVPHEGLGLQVPGELPPLQGPLPDRTTPLPQTDLEDPDSSAPAADSEPVADPSGADDPSGHGGGEN